MNDDFEKRLQRQPQRELPSAWREEILTKALESAPSVQTVHTPRPGLFHFIQILLSRPQRMAWTGLAAAWVVIVTLHLATSESAKPTSLTSATTPATPETIQALKQQRLLYAELVGRPEPHPMDRPNASIPGPRSQRRAETATA